MFRPGEDADEPAKHQLKAALAPCCGSSSGTGGCSPMMSFSSGTRSTISLTVRAQRLQKSVAPPAKLRVALAKKRSHQALKGLRERRIRDVALVLVELARCEEPTRRDEHLVQFIDDRGLANAGISGDQHQFRRAALDDAIEGGQQVATSRSRPYSFSGISSRSGVSCSPSGNGSMRP